MSSETPALSSTPRGSTGAPHTWTRCSCGRWISRCRCIGPHNVVVKPHPACGQLVSDVASAAAMGDAPAACAVSPAERLRRLIDDLAAYTGWSREHAQRVVVSLLDEGER